MKVTPKKFYEVEAMIVHCGPADGNDFTLCGFTLDGDQGEILEWNSGRIDCPQCVAIIDFCRSIHGRSVAHTSTDLKTHGEGA